MALIAVAFQVRAEEVSVAVAANFTAPLQKIALEFETETGHRVVASYGSTGAFYAQIRNGAPFELLLAADNETPARLIKEGSAVPGSQFTYAIGKLVLWSAKPGFVDATGEVLRKGNFEHLSLANPKLAPYGVAAMETLKAMGVLEKNQPRIVTAESITQALQFISTGNAQLGFVSLSQVLKGDRIEGSYWVVPANLHEPIQQDAVTLGKGRGKPAADALLKYLKGDRAKAIIRSFGYGP
jgi:molybdate transport system substrate-binding protein